METAQFGLVVLPPGSLGRKGVERYERFCYNPPVFKALKGVFQAGIGQFCGLPNR